MLRDHIISEHPDNAKKKRFHSKLASSSFACLVCWHQIDHLTWICVTNKGIVSCLASWCNLYLKILSIHSWMLQLHGFMHLIPNHFLKALPAWRPKTSILYWSCCVKIHLKPEPWHVLFEVFELNIALVWALSTSEGKETLSYSAHRQPVLEGCCLSSHNDCSS